jgi:D-psicose/D-tagatose/L-ribulose 3-epimerase
MPLALSNILWPAALDDAALVAVRDAGATGIEVAPTRVAPWDELTPEKLRLYRQRLAGLGLCIPSMQAILFGKPEAQLFGDAMQVQQLTDHLIWMADCANELGATKLVFGAPKNRLRGSLVFEEAIKLAAERLLPIASAYAERGVTLVIEAVPTLYGADFLHTAAEVAMLVRTIHHVGLQLHLDCGALLLSEEDVAVTVAAQADILAHVHLSRPQLKPITLLPLDGALASALSVADYRGWLSIEIGPQDDALPIIAQSIAVARQAYAPFLVS